jgi:hypothetical protein
MSWQAGGVSDDHLSGAVEPAARDRTVVAAVAVASVEAAAVAAYAVGIGVAAVANPGSVSAAPVAVAIFLVFAAGILACARGLWRRRRAARTPFGIVQLFGLVVGWTLTQGDGDSTHVAGYAVLVASVVGIALVVSPALGRELQT